MNNEEIKEETKIEQPEVKLEEVKDETVQEEKKEEKTVENNIINETKKALTKDKNSFAKFFKDLKEYITTKNTRELGELVVRLIFVAIIVIVFFLPVSLLKELIPNITYSLGINATTQDRAMYERIFTIVSNSIGIVLFFVLCRARFYEMLNKQKSLKEDKN